MTTETTLHPLADRYLRDMRRSGRVLPRGRRDELLADIHAHLLETAPAGAGEADVRAALDRLGDPDEIVAAEAGAGPAPGRRGVLEWCAIVLLLIGGVVIPVIGWIVGALLLWISRSWTLRDKVWGMLILPGGLLPAAWLVVADVSIESCRSSARGQSAPARRRPLTDDQHRVLRRRPRPAVRDGRLPRAARAAAGRRPIKSGRWLGTPTWPI